MDTHCLFNLLKLLETFTVGNTLIISTSSPVDKPRIFSRRKVVFRSFDISGNGTAVIIHLQGDDLKQIECCMEESKIRFDSNKYWQESSLKIEKA